MTAMWLTALFVLAIRCPAADNGLTLRGTVVDGASGRPMRDVEVKLQDLSWEPVLEPAYSDAQGRFAFPGLAAGEYILSADSPETGTVNFNEPPEPGWVVTVHMKPQEPEKAVVFRIMPRAAVSGTVRDQSGDPVEAAMVTLYRPAWTDGRIVLEQAAQTVTDDRGRYRAARLAPGGYVVCASAPQGQPAVASAGPVDFAARPALRVYTRPCYPERGGSHASMLKLTPASEMEVNLTLDTVAAVEVRGRIVGGAMFTGVSLVRDGEIPGENPLMIPTDESGAFSFHGVLPGRYRLEATSTAEDTKPLVARRPVDIGGGNSAIEVVLTPAAVFDVALHDESGQPVGEERVQLGLRSTGSNPEMFWVQDMPSDGVRTGGIPAGEYRVITRTSAGQISCIESVMLGEKNVLRGIVTVKPGMSATFDVTVSRNCGDITARVLDDGRLVPGAKVLLLLSGSAKNPEDVLADYAGAEGELRFTGLGAGRYRMWAWQVDTFGSFVGPVTLENIEAQSVMVEVKRGEHATVDVPLLHPEGASK